jgi:hypothetical protein
MLFFSGSYFFVILCLGAEHYQFGLFFVMAALYNYIDKRKSPDTFEGILMGGTCLTSGILVPFIIPFEGIKEYLKSITRYGILFVELLFVAGTAGSIKQLSYFVQAFGTIPHSVTERLFHATHFLEWCFIAPKPNIIWEASGVPGAVYTGTEPINISWFGSFILCVCIISAIVNRRSPLAKIAIINTLFFIAVCSLLGWAWDEEWLYAIFATWSCIVLIMQLLKYIFSIKMFSICASVLFIALCAVNICALTDFMRFCVQYYSVVSQ